MYNYYDIFWESSMKKKCCVLVFLFFIFGSVGSTVFAVQEGANTEDIIYVDDDNTGGPWDGSIDHPYVHIQDAIDAAMGGETIYVFAGTYKETVTVDKQLMLCGEHQHETIVDGTGDGTVIWITQEGATVENVTIKNSGGYHMDAGVLIDAENVTIRNCTVYRTRSGIIINGTRNNVITHCTFHTNGEGILLYSSTGNEIDYCCFVHNAIGVHYNHAREEYIHNCRAHTNGVGILGNDSSLVHIAYCVVHDHNDNQGGIFFTDASHSVVQDCVVRHNGVGVKTAYSSDILIARCHLLLNTHYAVRARDGSSNITITNCDVADSFRYGVYAQDSTCTVRETNFYGSTLHGLYAESSVCDARYNWWGSWFGPARFTGLRGAERVTWTPRKVLVYPWLRSPLARACAYPSVPDGNVTLPDDVHPTITFAEQDTDDDGCPDWWEEKWGYDPEVADDHIHLDPDGDALTNIEECYTDQWNSSPFHKDIFLEFDWMETKTPNATNKPSSGKLALMKQAFADHDITIHVDEGRLGGGEEIPYAERLSYGMVRDRYWKYFLHHDLNNPRKGIFHYGLICDYTPGGGFAVMGWDHVDSFALSVELLMRGFASYGREQVIVSASMHELGHTLGLFVDDFGGIDNLATASPRYKEFWQYLNYKSCMSYLYTWDIMDYSDGTHLGRDFDDWGNLDFSFFKDTHFEWPKD